MLSGQGQQAPRVLISSLPRPGEEQTAADKSPKSAAKDRKPEWETEHLEWRRALPLTWRSAGLGRRSLAEAIPGASGRRLPLHWASKNV